MKSLKFRPSLNIAKGRELALSGEGMIELLRAVMAKGVPFRFRLKGDSMLPFLKDGDVATIYPLISAMPKYGEIVAFIQPGIGKLSIHRVIWVDDHSVITKGDNNPFNDGYIQKENILGKLTSIERNGKTASLTPSRFRTLMMHMTLHGNLRNYIRKSLDKMKNRTWRTDR